MFWTDVERVFELRFIDTTDMNQTCEQKLFIGNLLFKVSLFIHKCKNHRKNNIQQFNTKMRHHCAASHGEKNHSTIKTLIICNTLKIYFSFLYFCPVTCCSDLLLSFSFYNFHWNKALKPAAAAAAVCEADVVVCRPLSLWGGGGFRGGVCPAALQNHKSPARWH